MKKIGIVLVVFAFSFSGGAFSQVATIDSNSPMQLAKMKEQLENMVNQLKQQKKEFDAITGNTGIGRILGNDGQILSNKIPKSWNDALNSSDFMNEAKNTMNKMNSDVDKGTSRSAVRRTNRKMKRNDAQNQAVMKQLYNDQQSEMRNLKQLQNAISKANTPKEINDLKARINVAQGSISSQQMRMQNLAKMQESQTEMNKQQRHRAFSRRMVGDSSSNDNMDITIRR